MSASDDRMLADMLDQRIRTVPGVSTLFRAGGMFTQLIGAGAQALRLRENSEPAVRVLRSPQGVRVEASIAVEGSTLAVVEHVHEAVTALCEQQGEPDAAFHLTVAQVSSR